MVRMMAFAAAIGFGLSTGGPARADFVLGNNQPRGLPTTPLSTAPTVSENPQDVAKAVEVSRFKIVRGFGDTIPLSFAVRQIVPSSVKVRYRGGIDPEALVSWRGNRPWNRVLTAAVRPLHLSIVTGVDSVLITR